MTDPEPLPAGHPLWDLPNCLITPHTADTEQMTEPLLAARITENVRRLAAGDALEGRVDPDLGNLVAKADLQNSKSGFPGSCFHREIFHRI